MSFIFNYYSDRSLKARLGYRIDGLLKSLLTVASIVFFVSGIVTILSGMSFGWIIIIPAIPIAMLIEWYKGELKDIPMAKDNNVDSLISTDVLGRLPKNPDQKDIALIIGRISSGNFLSVRFGITPNFLLNIANNQTSLDQFWSTSLEIASLVNSNEITGSIMAASLIKNFPNYDGLLAQMKLSVEDLIEGIKWYQHINDLVENLSKPKRTGGIARDWSFGYIPLLDRFGRNISEEISSGGLLNVRLETHQQIINQLVDTFGNAGRQNAVIVGPSGSGKTTIVYAFAEKLLDASADLPDDLKFRQIFILDSAALIAAARGRGELEDLIMRILGEAYKAKNIIICLDDAQLFFEEGVGSVDISNVLQPILEAGNLRVILTMDEQRLLQINQKNPALINSLNRINIMPATKQETLLVLEDKVLLVEQKRKVVYTYQALLESYRLSERYIYDLDMPGKAFKLLEMSAAYNNNGIVTMNSVHDAIEKTMNIKVGATDNADERSKLLNLENLIHQRMVDQVRAVNVVCDALRRARAGVRNENRPIGTFLFLGPTGVGKTELAKALAEVYFNGENNLVRIDMNEYVTQEDVNRLIADGADNPGSLTAQVMKQPFSVVLLDEIEKANPDILTTLLQLLDEGILRDIKNREVSFRDCIVIATSNAGADRIREYINRGYQLEQFEQQFVNELIDSHQFKPEFLNRFDEIVVFRPLEKPELLQVVDIIIAGINKTLAPQKITVTVDDDAKNVLVENGYDPRLGARPLRRVVQRAVENIIAKQVLSGIANSGSKIVITKDQVDNILENKTLLNKK
jgi:ATP-dependent Clp protease ATP-binding subunit ClpC